MTSFTEIPASLISMAYILISTGKNTSRDMTISYDMVEFS